MKSTDLMEAAEDEQAFVEILTRRLAARSPLRDIEFEFTPTAEQTDANVGADRLDDILTSLIESMAGIGVKHIKIATAVASDYVKIRLSSPETIDPAVVGTRRLDLYNRTLGWLGGSVECNQHRGSAEFLISLPGLQAA